MIYFVDLIVDFIDALLKLQKIIAGNFKNYSLKVLWRRKKSCRRNRGDTRGTLCWERSMVEAVSIS